MIREDRISEYNQLMQEFVFEGIAIALTTFVIRDFVRIKKAIKKYEEMNQDITPFKELTKKFYKKKKYNDEKEGDEVNGKLKLMFINPRVEEYYNDKELVFSLTYSVEPTGMITYRRINFNMISEDAKKHKDYYMCYALMKHGIGSKDTERWVNSVLKSK